MPDDYPMSDPSRGPAGRLTAADESYYREHFDASEPALADRRYEDVRPAYLLGHLAAYDPDLAGLEFEEVERELERRWNDEQRARLGEWPAVRGYANAGYARGSSFAAGLGDLPRRPSDHGRGRANDEDDRRAGDARTPSR